MWFDESCGGRWVGKAVRLDWEERLTTDDQECCERKGRHDCGFVVGGRNSRQEERMGESE